MQGSPVPSVTKVADQPGIGTVPEAGTAPACVDVMTSPPASSRREPCVAASFHPLASFTQVWVMIAVTWKGSFIQDPSMVTVKVAMAAVPWTRTLRSEMTSEFTACRSLPR